MYNDEVLLNEAIAKGELVQYLGGFPGYYLQPQAADLPTEFDATFVPIRNRIKDDPQLLETIVEAIIKLADDPEYGWGAIFQIANLANLKKYQGIDLLSQELISSVGESLRRNRESFKSLKRWEGKNHDDGIWALVRVKNRNIQRTHNITVLPEEL